MSDKVNKAIRGLYNAKEKTLKEKKKVKREIKKDKTHMKQKPTVTKPQIGAAQGHSIVGQKIGLQNTANVDSWGVLAPETQFQVSMLQPGLFNTPFIEDHEPSKYPTSIFAGQTVYPITTDFTHYKVIWLSPSFGACIGRSGVELVSLATGNTVTSILAGGASLSSVYGSTTPLARFVPFGSTLDVELTAPAATAAGVVYMGSLPVGSFNGSTVFSLIQSATTEWDLKRSSKFSLKSRIQNRAIIHYNKAAATATPDVDDPIWKEEFVAYAVIPPGPFIQIAGTGDVNYSAQLKIRSNAVWLPAVASPVLNSIALSQKPNFNPTTPIQTSACQKMEYSSANYQPINRGTISRIMDGLAKGSEMVADLVPGGKLISAGLGVINAFFNDTLLLNTDRSDEISDTNWITQVENSKWKTSSYGPDLHDKFVAYRSARQDFLDECMKESEMVSQVEKLKNECMPVVTEVDGVRHMEYYLQGKKIDKNNIREILKTRAMLQSEFQSESRSHSNPKSEQSRDYSGDFRKLK